MIVSGIRLGPDLFFLKPHHLIQCIFSSWTRGYLELFILVTLINILHFYHRKQWIEINLIEYILNQFFKLSYKITLGYVKILEPFYENFVNIFVYSFIYCSLLYLSIQYCIICVFPHTEASHWQSTDSKCDVYNFLSPIKSLLSHGPCNLLK